MQRNLQDFVNPFNGLDLQILLDIVRNLLQITHVFFWNDHRLDSAAVCSQKFFLQTTNSQHLAAQGNFTGHCHIRPHRDLCQRRDKCGAHANASARSILRRGAFRHVDVRVVFLVEISWNAQATGTAANYGLGCCNGFDHDITQRTGLDQLPLARYDRRFDGQQFAAHLSPR